MIDRILVDTSVLLRTLQVQNGEYEVVARAFELLLLQGKRLQIVPQNLVEFWVVATRPVERNGLGLSTTQAAEELTKLQSMFDLLPETSSIFMTWKALVTQYGVSGKPAHDARIVAAMKVHGLRSILTFDQTGFSRFSGIQVINPSTVKAYVPVVDEEA